MQPRDDTPKPPKFNKTRMCGQCSTGDLDRPPGCVAIAKPRTEGLVQVLCDVAKASNSLAKRSIGSNRARAFAIKVAALDTLIREGWAKANGVERNLVGLDLACEPPMRLHVPLLFLTPVAREEVMAQIHVMRRTARLMDAEELDEGKFANE